MRDKLTEKTYWEKYYEPGHAKKKHIIGVCSYYDWFWEQLFNNKNGSRKSLIEIGGYPGRYLAYLASKYQIETTCLDYNSDASQIEKTFEVMEVENYTLLQEDFISFQTPKTYDYVISNGFIEHFKDFDAIMDNHVPYLNENGRMLMMIPNMKGYIKLYKYMVDHDNMKVHNLKCMNLKVFKDFASRNDLKISHLEYYGGFPIGVHKKLNPIQKVIYQAHRLFFKKIANPYLQKHPSRFFSSAIIAIFEKQ